MKGVGAKQQQVGAFADFNGAEILGEAEGRGVVEGGGTPFHAGE